METSANGFFLSFSPLVVKRGCDCKTECPLSLISAAERNSSGGEGPN